MQHPSAQPQHRLVAALSVGLLLTTVLLSGCLFLLNGSFA
jgi:hypothetical protein